MKKLLILLIALLTVTMFVFVSCDGDGAGSGSAPVVLPEPSEEVKTEVMGILQSVFQGMADPMFFHYQHHNDQADLDNAAQYYTGQTIAGLTVSSISATSSTIDITATGSGITAKINLKNISYGSSTFTFVFDYDLSGPSAKQLHYVANVEASTDFGSSGWTKGKCSSVTFKNVAYNPTSFNFNQNTN